MIVNESDKGDLLDVSHVQIIKTLSTRGSRMLYAISEVSYERSAASGYIRPNSFRAIKYIVQPT